MDRLRAQIALSLLTLLAVLLLVDVVDCLFLGNRYEVPTALFGLFGTIVGGLFVSSLLGKRNGNGNGKAGSESKTTGNRPPGGGAGDGNGVD